MNFNYKCKQCKTSWTLPLPPNPNDIPKDVSKWNLPCPTCGDKGIHLNSDAVPPEQTKPDCEECGGNPGHASFCSKFPWREGDPRKPKPREWWLLKQDIADEVFTDEPPDYYSEMFIQVIEKSAFERVAQERDGAIKLREMIEANRDQLRIDKAELERERDNYMLIANDWAAKYRSIEVANPELTRNDHVTFGNLMLERARLRSALEAVLAESSWPLVKHIARTALDSK